jgi:hypothetical protein
LVSTTPVSGSASPKALAVLAASWPVIIDHEQGFGRVDRRVQGLDLGHRRVDEAAGGVDQQHVDERLARVTMAARTMSTGFCGLRREEQHAGLLGQVLSCSIAAGRYTSADTTITFFLRFSFRCLASLPTVVVLPAPCRPAIRMMAGAGTLRFRSPPARPSRRSARRAPP